ncbi:MAG: 4Fe-4S binding protein [Eggerthellaceae bacterium]|nr:4Fe-4S binding protein [Eggerthellaceae bacterium]
MTRKMLVDLDRCIGCWTCAMACKVGNHLTDDEYRIEVETHGSGAGIDRPAGVYPDLHMTWQPVWADACTFCPERLAAGNAPFCVNCCPTFALAFGEEGNPESDYAQAVARVTGKGARLFALEGAAAEGTRANVVYAKR